ncbi:hypothetical protein [Aeromonas dhakensis]|nr:hypothetical protein [Aeromonas dhakensis]
MCQWAAEGKQVSDIAQILGIPPKNRDLSPQSGSREAGSEQ